MKKIAILLSLIVSVTLVYPQSNEIPVLNVDEDVLVFSQSTLDTISLNGLQLKMNQYTNISDWNNDGLNDIILNIASNDTITDYVALFKRQETNGELQFVEDPNYLMNALGRVAEFNNTVGDINEDGLLDILIVTQNYHGPEGQQPPFYLGSDQTTDKLFINTGQGFNRFVLDTTMEYKADAGLWKYWSSNGQYMFDWDLDGDLEVLVSESYYDRIRNAENPVYDRLFSSFDIDSNDNISREFAFEWPLPAHQSISGWINTDLRLFSSINDTVYLAHYNIVGWDTLDSVFVDPSLIDHDRYIREYQYKVLVIDINQSFGINSLIDTVSLINEKRGGFVVENGFGVSDIDNDGKMEFLTYWWHETNQLKEDYLRIFDDDGVDITEQLMPIEWFDDPRTGGSGFTIIDLNNDGFDDILPRNGWVQMNEQGRFTSYGIFLNDSGNRFIRYDVDFTSSPDYYTGIFNHPIDIDNDGYYEILNILHSYDTPNVDITTLDYNFTIGAPIFLVDYEDQLMNEDDTLQVILLASNIDEGIITFTAKSDTSAVQIMVTDSVLTIIPILDWHGTATITAYATNSIGTRTNSTSFKLTVTPVNDIASVQDVTIDEDKSAEVTLTSTFTRTTTFTAVSDTNAVTVSVSSATLTLTPNANWNGVANIKAYASDGSFKDSTIFKLTVTAVQDAPTSFDWVSSALDTINITQSNLDDNYNLQWSASTDAADGDSIEYLIYAQMGVDPAEPIYDTTSTSIQITYEEFLENVFEPFPMLPRVTVQFFVEATDGTDTVKVTGDDRVVYVNRYEYLSTESEGIPTEFALHENYPNPFNPTTTLRFDLPEVSDMTLIIYNMLGQKVKTFSMQSTPAGYHSVKWNATNDYGEQVGAGVYLYQLRAKDFVKTRKMVLLK